MLCQDKNHKNTKRTRIVLSLFFVSFFLLSAAHSVSALSIPEHKYPRTVAFFLKTSPFTEDEVRALAKFQVVILDAQTQITNIASLRRLRILNPTITLLAYTSSVEYPQYRHDIERPNGIWYRIGEGLQPAWFLKTVAGDPVSFWPGNVMMNPGARDATGKTYAYYLADFFIYNVLSTGFWDGLFFDTVWDGIHWLNPNTDIDGDGNRDTKEKIDQMWRDGQNLFFKLLRNNFGDRYLLVGNGVLEPYAAYLNGRMFEGFPDPSEGEWPGSLQRYRTIAAIGVSPQITMINSDTKNTGNWKDWRRMRYGLTTTLLLDGYYNFDYGTKVRDILYWYDEYNISLGKPSSFPAKNLLANGIGVIARGVWRRDFQNGMVLVNSTTSKQTINLDEEFERIHGKQDPETNDGAITTRVTLPPESGILLMRPIDAIRGSPYVNGAFARIMNAAGDTTRTGFFAYEAGRRGGTMIARRDLDRDGDEELIVAEINRVEIYAKSGKRIARFFPYGEGASHGIRFAFGDVDRDGRDEIVTAPANGGNAEIKIFRMNGSVLHRGWRAFGSSFFGGASVAVGDVNGDGALEIVVGSGAGRKPEVRIFRANGSLWNSGWLAYATGFRGGVNVAVGDLDGDRRAEIITGAGRGGGPHVRIFSANGALVNRGFFAFAPTKREGVDVLAHDFDGDGKAEIVAMSTNVFTTAQLFRR